MQKPTRPGKEKRRGPQSALVEAASRIFLATSYDRATVGAIAREAGVSLATLYKHFATKADLFGAVTEHLVSALNERIAAINLKDLNILLALRQFAESYASVLRRRDSIAVFRIIIAEGSRFPELTDLLYERGKEPVRQRFEASLAERRARGDTVIWRHCDR